MTFGRPSLVRRLVLLATIWSLAALLVTSIVLIRQFEASVIRRFDDGLSGLAENLLAGAEIKEGAVLPPLLTDLRATRAHSGRYWQISEQEPGGRIVSRAHSRSLFPGDAALALPAQALATFQADPSATARYDARGPEGETLRVAAKRSILSGRTLFFLAAEDRAPVDLDAKRFSATAIFALLLLGAGLIAAVLIQVRVGLEPLFALQREVAGVRQGKADRLDGRYPVELSPLADELNALLAHNQEVVERQRTHVGNLAHALKTPLSVMLAEAQGQPGGLAEVVSRQARAMHEHVDHHLRRARAAARSQGQRERTALAPVIDELAVTLERIFRDPPVEIDWRCDDDLCFLGERQDLMEIVGNLMENACKWSRGRVRVSAEPIGDNRLAVTVEDDGPGVPQDRRAEILRRGARLDEKTPGSGLGLSIVVDLSRAYGGDIDLGESAWGGLQARLVLPRAEA